MRPPKFPVIDGKKQCSKCRDNKPHTFWYFKESHGKPGSVCRSCTGSSGRSLAKAHWDRCKLDPSFNEKWAAEQKAYYHSEAGQRSYRNSWLKKQFGITLAQYEARLDSQGGVCALCHGDDPKGRGAFHVDHDHSTGAIRGLLCHSCNTGLGSLGDSPVLLVKAVQYLRKDHLELLRLSESVKPLRGRDGQEIVVEWSVARRDPGLKRDYMRNSELLSQYGVSLPQVHNLLRLQGDGCGICQSADPKGRGGFHVDHDHVTRAVRGLLCHTCNVGIGSLRDDSDLIERGIPYLRDASGTSQAA